MKSKLYFIVSLIILIVAIAIIIVPTIRFQQQQYRLATPIKVRVPAAPKMEKPIAASRIATPELEKAVMLAAEPDKEKHKLLNGNSKRLQQAQQAAQGWIVKVPVANQQQAQQVIKTFQARGLLPFSVDSNKQLTVYIGPMLTEHNADEVAARLPAMNITNGSVEPYVPQSYSGNSS